MSGIRVNQTLGLDIRSHTHTRSTVVSGKRGVPMWRKTRERHVYTLGGKEGGGGKGEKKTTNEILKKKKT